jgi:type IV pilus assembly protein PilY1
MGKLSRLNSAFHIGALAVASCLLAASSALAEDIDIYSMPSIDGMRPNILIMIDNTANWGATIPTPPCPVAGARVSTGSPKEEGTKMGAEKCALYTLINSMSVEDLGQFNFALMLFNESPDSSSYPRQAFLNVTTAAQKQSLLDLISGLHINNDKGNGAATAEAFYEAYMWFTGGRVHFGNKTVTKHDAAAFADASKSVYRSPGVTCAKNHLIYLANGSPGDNNTRAYELLRRINPEAARIRIPSSEGVSNSDEANWADEFAAFFNRGADLSADTDGQQNIQVHTIAVTGASSDGNYPNFIRWIAKQGGGLYQEARTSEMIISAFSNIFNQIRSANSVFASASLPVSANTQGTYLNQVFIGMFRPDGNALPRWIGNLKQYQFSYNEQTDTLQLADANGAPAVSPTTGFIQPAAVSFWTQPSEFWIKREIESSGRYSRSDLPDGEVIEKGGIAQWLRTMYLTSSGSRPVYTCPGTCTAGTDLLSAGLPYQFSTSNVALTPSMFGLPADDSTTRKDLLINWIRGDENIATANVVNETVAKDQLSAPPDGARVRPAIHGDVLHSRPVAINYGSSRGVVVYYGGNDGLLRAINGNQTGDGAGSELWAFAAPEHFPKMNRLRENRPEILYPSTMSGATASPRDYFFDGPIGFYQNVLTSEVIIFPAMRRGGHSVYAFNVSNPNQPRIQWQVTRATAGYANLGQTWSMPKVTPVKGRADPVLLMGGGFDNVAEDSIPQGTTTRGTGVYVMDMRTGARLAHLPTDFSVPGDISLVDMDGDGYVDRAYLVDVRAQVYRIDIEGTDGALRAPTSWKITKIAAMNDGSDGVSGTRKVFFAPDVVMTRDYLAILFGTGDREHPLIGTTNDAFFLVKDMKVTKGEPTSVTVITQAQLSSINTATDAPADPEGCYYSLATNGEKVINQPITFGGLTYFSTTRPVFDSNACSRAESRAYQLPLVCKPPRYRNLVGDGLPPSPVVGYVDVGGGKLVPFVIGGPNDNNSAIEASRAQVLVPGKRRRSYWYIENRDR